MVKTDDLELVVDTINGNRFGVAYLPIILCLSQFRHDCDVVPSGIVQSVAHHKGVNIHDTNDFQRINSGLLTTVENIHDSPITQLGRIKHGITIRLCRCGQRFTSFAHGNGCTAVCHDMNFGRRTLLAQSIQSVIHRGVAAAQFQCRLGGVGQQICLAHGCADHITACGVQTNVEGGGSGEKLCAPFLEGCRHIGRSLDRTGLTVALNDSIFHEISSLLSAVIQTNIGESVHRAVDLGI